MRRIRYSIVLMMLSLSLGMQAITPEALADSLNCKLGLQRTRWQSKVKVDRIEQRGRQVSVYSNRTLSGISFSPAGLDSLRRQVGLWTMRDSNAAVSIYAEDVEIGTLISSYHRPNGRRYTYQNRSPRTQIEGLTPLQLPGQEEWTQSLQGRYIALWPSHGTYYNKKQELWRWQRATMWTTVEDLYTTEYTRQICRMLERAGAVVLQPRPRLEGRDLMKRNGRWEFRETGEAYKKGRSGMMRWQEAAREWLQYAGFPDTIYDPFKGENDYKSDMLSRGKWVNFLIGGSEANPTRDGLGIPVDLCLALHTDGLSEDDNRSIVGTLAIYYSKGTEAQHQQRHHHRQASR